jgi:hypothetical protein
LSTTRPSNRSRCLIPQNHQQEKLNDPNHKPHKKRKIKKLVMSTADNQDVHGKSAQPTEDEYTDSDTASAERLPKHKKPKLSRRARASQQHSRTHMATSRIAPNTLSRHVRLAGRVKGWPIRPDVPAAYTRR